MKYKKLVTLVIVLIASISLIGCKKEEAKDINATEEVEEIEQVVTEEVQETEVEDIETVGEVEDELAEIEEFDLGETQTIGSDLYGYLQVPIEFVPFEDVSGGEQIQYSDGSGTNIFTMNIYEGVDVETAADNLFASMEADEDISGLEGAKVSVGIYDAYQIYGYYSEEDIFLVMWLLSDPVDTNKGYYLAAEFTSDQQQLFYYIDTFQMPSDAEKSK